MALTRAMALALLTAALLSTAARPWAPGLIAWFALVPLLLALGRERHWGRGALLGWLAALGGGLVAFEGVAPAAPWAYPLLVLVASVPGAVVGALYVLVGRRLGDRAALLAYPVLVAASEFVPAQRWLFGDFANALTLLGVTQFDTPLRLVAAWSGIGGVGLLVAALNVAVVVLVRERRPLPLIMTGVIALLLVVLPIPGTDVRDPARTSLRVAVIQGAVSSVDTLMARFDGEAADRMLGTYAALTDVAAERGVDLVVWGETVLPQPVRPGPVSRSVANALASAPVALVGGVSYVGGRSFNSVFNWNDGALTEVYRKRALVPFNERHYTAGGPLPPLDVDGVAIGLGVCLDSVFGSLAREAVRAGARMLVILTEDGFAGQTVTPEMHLRLSAFRSIETGRWSVFANQSGPSAFIDQRGRVVERLPVGRAAGLLVEVPAYVGVTPFVRFGDWIGALATVVGAMIVILAFAARPGRST